MSALNRPLEVEDFAVQYARTQRFSLGEPRNLTIFESFALFLRSDAGDDPTHHLWGVGFDGSDEVKLVDAFDLAAGANSELPAAERARRERLREGGAGITAYSTSRDGTVAAFALQGRLFCVEISHTNEITATLSEVAVTGLVFDPRLSPDGSLIGFVRDRQFVIVDRDGSVHTEIGEDDPAISWGAADFIAAEEMGRMRGFWWAPDGAAVAVCRNDVSAVERWWIAEPADPALEPTLHRYPQAGTPNPLVALYIVPVDGARVPAQPTEVEWDRDEFEYLTSVNWNSDGLVVGLQSRDQRTLSWWRVDPETGAAEQCGEDSDERWVELVPGSGTTRSTRLVETGRADDADGVDDADDAMSAAPRSVELITAGDRDGARRLLVDGEPVSPPEIQIRSIISVDEAGVLLTGNPIDDSTVVHLYRWSDHGFEAMTTEPGVHGAVGRSDRFATRRTHAETPGASWELPGGRRLASLAHTPPVVPRPRFLQTGPNRCATAVLLPTDHDGSALPVLLDPYGGPHALRALRSYQALAASQWFADQGFAVVITDGRGTPGRGTAYERAVYHDLATGVLDDQVAGLHDAAEQVGGFDLDRVAIRGWSFGGFLAALAVMARPDVFHVGVAGAPVTDWRWYDTHYTERYLGNPTVDASPYERSSLIPLAPQLERPLLLIHGLADDNVVAAHTLHLSSALLAAGRPHEVLPLSGVTHMTPQVEVARNLLVHQLRFIKRHLAERHPAGRTPNADPAAV